MKFVTSRAPSPRAALRLLALRFSCLLAGWAVSASCLAQVGHDYVLAWPETGDATGDDPGYDLGAQLIVVAARGTVRARVTGPGLDRTVTARPGAPGFVELERSRHMVVDADRPKRQALRVTGQTCEPFALLLRVPGSGASVADDVARLLPTALLGRHYRPVAAFGRAEFVVVATEDGTVVEIDDPACGSPPPVPLDEGEVLLHRCENEAGGGDVTGSRVEASAPVAVLTGSASSRVLSVVEGGDSLVYWDFADVLLEGLWPEDLWGRRFVHAPFAKASSEALGDALRAVAACGGSRLWVETGEQAYLASLPQAGDSLWLGPEGADPRGSVVAEAAFVSATRPVQLAALTVGHENAGHGDPSLTLLDPEERWEREAVAWLPGGYDHSLSIAVANEHAASVRVDGAVPRGSWQPAGNQHSWLRLDRVAAGEHRVSADGPVFVQVSGFTAGGQPGAYSYPAIAVPPQAVPRLRIEAGGPSCTRACAGACFELSLPRGFTAASWSDGTTGPVLDTCRLASAAEVSVVAEDAAGCPHEGTIVLDVAPPRPAGPIEGPEETCPGECVILQAPMGLSGWAWSTGGMSEQERVCADGDLTVRLEARDAGGCLRETEHSIRLRPAPVPGAPLVEPPDPCHAAADLSWTPAEWPDGATGGVYHVYRREGGCAPPEDPSWELLATGLEETAWRDRNVPPGRAWTWRIVAEADDAGTGCGGGPLWNGSADSACAEPQRFRAPMPPDPPPPVSPWLRVHDPERDRLGGPCRAVTLSWHGAPEAPADSTVEVRRSNRPELLRPWARPDEEGRWRDDATEGEALLFYRIRRLGPCGRTLD